MTGFKRREGRFSEKGFLLGIPTIPSPCREDTVQKGRRQQERDPKCIQLCEHQLEVSSFLQHACIHVLRGRGSGAVMLYSHCQHFIWSNLHGAVYSAHWLFWLLFGDAGNSAPRLWLWTPPQGPGTSKSSIRMRKSSAVLNNWPISSRAHSLWNRRPGSCLWGALACKSHGRRETERGAQPQRLQDLRCPLHFPSLLPAPGSPPR